MYGWLLRLWRKLLEASPRWAFWRGGRGTNFSGESVALASTCFGGNFCDLPGVINWFVFVSQYYDHRQQTNDEYVFIYVTHYTFSVIIHSQVIVHWVDYNCVPYWILYVFHENSTPFKETLRRFFFQRNNITYLGWIYSNVAFFCFTLP